MKIHRVKTALIACPAVLLMLVAAAQAQSWSAWKQLADEQAKSGKTSQAEESWRSALRLLQQSGARDSRLFISAAELSKLLLSEKKTDEARQILGTVCTNDLTGLNSASDEEMTCLKTYLALCSERPQDKSEFDRVQKLLEQVAKNQSTAHASSSGTENQVSLLFGESAQNELNKKVMLARRLARQSDFTGAEKSLTDALAIAESIHAQASINLVLTEQASLYCITKNFRKAEQIYSKLLELAKQDAGPESQKYVQLLGPHARLLRALGDNKQAALEETRCEVIASKFKITPGGFQYHEMPNDNRVLVPPAGESGAGRPNNLLGVVNPTEAIPYVAANPQVSAPRPNGRLKVIEFYATW